MLGLNHVDIKRAIWSHTNAECAPHTPASRELCFANDEGVCIPATLLFHRLETLTQINRQHGPAITISVSPLLPASSIHSLHCCTHAPPHPSPPPSALISWLQSISPPPSHSSSVSLRPRSHISPPPLPLHRPFCIYISPPVISSLTSHDLAASLPHSCTLSPSLPLPYILLHISPLTSPLSRCLSSPPSPSLRI